VVALQPLHGFQSTNGFVANADNDVDLDNNGFGSAFLDIMSGIVTLISDGEPLNDGDPFDCYFDCDASGINTVDFGFFKSNAAPPCPPDLDNSGAVNVSDILIVLGESAVSMPARQP